MAGSSDTTNGLGCHQTRVLPIDTSNIHVRHTDSGLETLSVSISPGTRDEKHLSIAANAIRSSSIPVAFPTETVYGLAADATRSSAVRGIYAAKNRPADNPLIVHISSLTQLRKLLSPSTTSTSLHVPDSIPSIYYPLIARFWPGPLTIILPLPIPSPFAPEVSAGLQTFGARMPSATLALALIHAADRPLAAPSANASTKPSPTRAEHVLHDLKGKIEIILDGGDCDVGVESTVVDGLHDPPAILRPGGISLDMIRDVPGWETTVIGYKDKDEAGSGKREAPRAPGMKYKHYSPSARVVLVKSGLVDAGNGALTEIVGRALSKGYRKIGILRGPKWAPVGKAVPENASFETQDRQVRVTANKEAMELKTVTLKLTDTQTEVQIIDAGLGQDAEGMARNLFRGLREMDLHEVDIIFVEGLDESQGTAAAAVMNRLKKAAETQIDSLEQLAF